MINEKLDSVKKDQYSQMTDEILIQNINSNDSQALQYLIKKYTDIVNMKANKFFMVGAEKEDMVQEGFIGLYKAVKSFNAQKQNSFKTFANLCIERQLITAVKNSNRQKHMPLNSSLSLNTSAYQEDEDESKMDVLDLNQTQDDPLEIITTKEYYNSVETKINESLSEFEKKVLHEYQKGQSYLAIAEKLQIKTKSVDTAIQRIRKKAIKIKQKMEEGEKEK